MSEFKSLQQFFIKFGKSIASCIKIIIQSRSIGDYPIGHKDLVILGNGPSLTQMLQDKQYFLENKDLMAVNKASISEYYEQIRPKYYLLMDPLFFQSGKTMENTIKAIVEKTKWTMDLFVPINARSEKIWQSCVRENKNITIRWFNATPVEGFQSFAFNCYKKGWGMPRPRNVLIPCMMVGLRMNYSKIYLAGAENSWLKEIWVDDDNKVNMDLAHFYDKKSTERKVSPLKLHEILESMVIAFRSYHSVEKFSRSQGEEIINITDGSYIDAFSREKI
ncbi:MAG: hypothetical protein PHY69_00095 [Dysgonamonadaceae bacterium]|nr:hypothetical protein [Dysgonamonadaceae bacterium]MDD3308348.1 hypothetical protein [Dysgonamonadaceae bacterium]MDD3900269.1 hypothetical protein [Dysgonamonadaceae bacterium]MDD4398825.1 hypothetical protein [Dysgonamonadaceae bacterium]